MPEPKPISLNGRMAMERDTASYAPTYGGIPRLGWVTSAPVPKLLPEGLYLERAFWEYLRIKYCQGRKP